MTHLHSARWPSEGKMRRKALALTAQWMSDGAGDSVTRSGSSQSERAPVVDTIVAVEIHDTSVSCHLHLFSIWETNTILGQEAWQSIMYLTYSNFSRYGMATDASNVLLHFIIIPQGIFW